MNFLILVALCNISDYNYNLSIKLSFYLLTKFESLGNVSSPDGVLDNYSESDDGDSDSSYEAEDLGQKLRGYHSNKFSGMYGTQRRMIVRYRGQ